VTVLALEPVGGIAGDMLLAALLQLGAPRAALDEGLAALAEASGAVDLRGTRVVAEPVEVSGIRALRVEVRVPADVRGREPHHRPWRAIREMLGRARLPDRARELALSAFARLAEAEGRVHGVAPDEVEFHEVGAVDSIVDVVGSALLVAALAPSRVVCLPPPSGGGTGRTAHGPIPIPAPAVLELLRGRLLRPSGPGERTTPTGAAVIAAWTEAADALPELAVLAVGYGSGTSRWEDAPNLLRAVLGDSVRGQPGGGAGWVVEANLDDLSPQLVAAALEAALLAGAADAWIAPVTMKKGRPGHLLGAVVPEGARAAVEATLFRETSTLGVRAYRVERSVLDREIVEVATRYGPVRVKVGRRAGTILNVAPEFEDCRARAQERGVPVKEVVAAALAAWGTRSA
jgi:pyridinium-3,5-bisthiocarboxylic acid mononucleotide nickel chelatase